MLKMHVTTVSIPEKSTDHSPAGQPGFSIHFRWRGKDYYMAMGASNRISFQKALLPQGPTRWRYFGAGAVIVLLLLLLLVSVPFFFPDSIRLQLRNYVLTALAPSDTHASKPLPFRRRKLSQFAVERPPTTTGARIVLPSPVNSAPVARVPAKPFPNVAPDLATQVRTAPSLSVGDAAIPNLKKPRQEVRVGGFGDPDGARNDSNTNRPPNIAQLGGFDQAASSMNGVGSSSRRVVSVAGFGSGTAASGTGGRKGMVQEGMFGNESTAGTPGFKKVRATESLSRPVEILFKPTPVYTDLARAKKIEGEVLLEVEFSATGQLQVLRVIRGLGYGLDESAEAAAGEIRFRPARDPEGLPVNSTAIVHIVFQLAY